MGQERTLRSPRRRAICTRVGDLASAINKALRQRCQRPILDRNEPDRRGRRVRFDRQHLDAHRLTAKAHHRGGDEAKPASRFDQPQIKMEGHRHYRCGWNVEATPAKRLVLQRSRETARFCQYPRFSDQIAKRRVSPLCPTTLKSCCDHMRFIEQRLGNQVRFRSSLREAAPRPAPLFDCANFHTVERQCFHATREAPHAENLAKTVL